MVGAVDKECAAGTSGAGIRSKAVAGDNGGGAPKQGLLKAAGPVVDFYGDLPQ